MLAHCGGLGLGSKGFGLRPLGRLDVGSMSGVFIHIQIDIHKYINIIYYVSKCIFKQE